MTMSTTPKFPALDHLPEAPPSGFSRRQILLGGAASAAGLSALPWLKNWLFPATPVFLAENQRYDGPLEETIKQGLLAVGIDPAGLKDRRVLLKPNLVEPARVAPQMTTHPAIVIAVAHVFRGWGATVHVGEAPGHLRDTEMALDESGLGEALREAKIPFDDLNYQAAARTANVGQLSPLAELAFPSGILEADLVVSLPKLKTHHWMGMTAAMKNLYGTLPGTVYGWPKNVLHHAGIPQTVVDIFASLPPVISVVDGIVCMEGDGPILGEAKPLGLIAVGANLPALDATLARIMQLDPARIPYLAAAAGRFGPLDDRRITQRGERWQTLSTPFAIVDAPHLNRMRA